MSSQVPSSARLPLPRQVPKGRCPASVLPGRQRLAGLWLGLIVFAAGGCTGGGLGQRGAPTGPAAPAAGLEHGDPDAVSLPPVGPESPAVEPAEPVHLGAESWLGTDGSDARLEALRAVWDDEVAAALERVTVVTGLVLPGVEVRLAALGDEEVPFEVRTAVRDGVRTPLVVVNAEPIVAGRISVARVLLRALGAAAYEGAAGRHGPVPRWLREVASTAAAGDLERRMEGLARALAQGAQRATRVDADDPEAAVATGAAALLLLADAERPGEVRRFLRYAAEGDDASALLGRMAREPGGDWVGRARVLLLGRLQEIDASAWRWLEHARQVLAEEGRAGLLAIVPQQPAAEIADDLALLLAQAAAQEGDLAAARALLRGLPPDAGARLLDPAAALALHARLEARAGGDGALARKLAVRLDRDYPRSPHRLALRDEHPLLGLEEDPQYWLAATRERMEREGVEAIDLRTAERYARLLLVDLRAGEAARFLAALGERGRAPELLAVGAAVAEAQREPSPAAVARAQQAVTRWDLLSGDPVQAAEILASGGAAVPALLEVLDQALPERRGAVLSLLARSGGAYASVRALAPRWERNPAWVVPDLRTLLGVVAADELRALLPQEELRRLSGADPAALWSSATLDLPAEWLDRHPDYLLRLGHDAYAVRRAAFDQAVMAGGSVLTPRLVALGLRDPAALLREAAADAAGRAGFVSLARLAMDDESPRVREVGVMSVARLAGAEAVPLLKALGLLRAAPSDADALDMLLGTQAEEDATVREAVALGLREAPALGVVRAIARALRRAALREQPISAFLVRITTLYQRITREDLRYVPGAAAAQLRAMALAAETWAEREERVGPTGVSASRSGGR